ncbi:MAG: response regulator transcription factor, partial [Alphaproteobacteria bacterium]
MGRVILKDQSKIYFTDKIVLTSREADVLSCLTKDRSTKIIAYMLNISPRTVETHIQNLFLKTGAGSRDALRNLAETCDCAAFRQVEYIVVCPLNCGT